MSTQEHTKKASFWVKVNTGAADNVMPLCVFCPLYLDSFYNKGWLIGIWPVLIRLPTYNRIAILQVDAYSGEVEARSET